MSVRVQVILGEEEAAKFKFQAQKRIKSTERLAARGREEDAGDEPATGIFDSFHHLEDFF